MFKTFDLYCYQNKARVRTKFRKREYIIDRKIRGGTVKTISEIVSGV